MILPFVKLGKPVDGAEAEKIADDVHYIQIDDGNWSAADGSSYQNGANMSTDRISSQGRVGSLSFNVVDASTGKEADPQVKQVGDYITGSANKNPPGTKVHVRKPVPRAKVPFEKGYSQMDWLNLTRTHPDLAGLNGQSNRRLITFNEVKQHKSEGSMWTVLKGRVYNITPYKKFHPGGVDMLMKAVGKDCTSLFSKYHAWVNAEFLLEKCFMGILDEGQ